MTEPQDELMKCLKRLYEDEEYSDLVIKCQNAKYNVHKALVCPRSEFFAAACRWKSAVGDREHKRRRTEEGTSPPDSSPDSSSESGKDPESKAPVSAEEGASSSGPGEVRKSETLVIAEERASSSGSDGDQESETQVIDLDDDDPVAVWATVQYLYHLEYPTPTPEIERIVLSGGKEAKTISNSECPSKTRTWSYLLQHARIYSIAEKYGIFGLKELARGKFEIGIKGKADLGMEYNFFLCLREVYTGTPQQDRGLRQAMTTTITNNMSWIKRDDLLHLMEEIPQVAIDVLTEYHRHVTAALAPARTPVSTRVSTPTSSRAVARAQAQT